jgi:hypothetical protein
MSTCLLTVITSGAVTMSIALFVIIRKLRVKSCERTIGLSMQQIYNHGFAPNFSLMPYETACQKYPQSVSLLLVYVTLLDWAGLNSVALKVLQANKTLLNTNPHLALQYAWALIDTNIDLAEAKIFLDRALEMRHKSDLQHEIDVCVQDSEAWMLYLTGNANKALVKITPILPLAPINPDIAYHAGVIQLECGMMKDAREHLRIALANTRPFGRRREAKKLELTFPC